ncbi:MAG: hypothetical protein CSA94_00735 [Bacteroidetes bacterium]|nr:MAG: hypothetical protein CSA94_00735 [Bacteroidota bacterium]
MKNKLLYIVLFFLVVSYTSSQAQSIKAVIGAGTNLSQVDGDQVYGFHKIGLNLAAQAMFPLTSNLFATLELNYNEKGAFQKKQNELPDQIYTGEYHLRLKYLEIPVMIQYNDKDIVTGGIGASYARLLNTFEEEHSGNVSPYSDTVAFNEHDILGFLDLQFRVYKKFYVNLRYSYSIMPIRKRWFHSVNSPDKTWKRYQYNNSLMIRLNYRINEKKKSKSGLDI